MAGSSTRKEELQNKRALFTKLSLIAKPNSLDLRPDPSREASEKAFKRRVLTPATRPTHSPAKVTKTRSSITASTPRIEPGPSSRTAVIQVANTPATTPSNVETAAAATTTVNRTAPTRGSNARKRSAEVPEIIAQTPIVTKQPRKRQRKNPPFKPVIPQAQQIFRGQHLYFFPNLATHAARKLRIAKAQEYGATWIQDFNDSVTHVVVDKGMNFSEILRFLKLDGLPAEVAVVSEDYPAICIANRSLLDPEQDQFRVRGHTRGEGVVGGEKAKGKGKQREEPEMTGLVPRPPGKDVAVREQESSAEKGKAGVLPGAAPRRAR